MKIFISYRRDDTAGYAGRLFDHLTARFGKNSVFMDIDTIQPGEDFRKVVQSAVGTCDVVLVLIGKQWLSIADGRGQRRLDDPRDWVRAEIAGALANPRIRVIPVLVRNASMPGEHELPEDLRELPYRNAIELSDSRFQHDVTKLIGVIERAMGAPAPRPPAPARRSALPRWGLVLGLAVLGLVTCLAGYRLLPALLPAAATASVTAEQEQPTPLESAPTASEEVSQAALSAPSLTPENISSPTASALPATPTATPDWYGVLDVRRPAEEEIVAGVPPSIWEANNIQPADILSPGRARYSGFAQPGGEYLFSVYWCAKTDAILRQNLLSLLTVFLVDGQVIPERYVITYDAISSLNWKCSYNAVILSGWVGFEKYKLEARRTIRADVNDGSKAYPQGEYTYELDIEAR